MFTALMIAPEVMVLRSFRDKTLKRSAFGRGFIRLYYVVSPSAVKLFGNKKLFRKIRRKALDILIKILFAEK